jgi:hypothetical protein
MHMREKTNASGTRRDLGMAGVLLADSAVQDIRYDMLKYLKIMADTLYLPEYRDVPDMGRGLSGRKTRMTQNDADHAAHDSDAPTVASRQRTRHGGRSAAKTPGQSVLGHGRVDRIISRAPMRTRSC